MEAFAYFPSLIYRDERPEWVPHLRNALAPYLEQIRSSFPVGQPEPPVLQTHSLLDDANFRELKEYLYEVSDVVLRDQGYDMDKYEIKFSGLWGQSISAGAGTDVHVHKNSQLSGWIFIDRPDNGAYPIFKDPRFGKAMVELDFNQGEEVTQATNTINFGTVVPGTVIVANSWLPHQIIGGFAERKTTTIHFIVTCQERGSA